MGEFDTHSGTSRLANVLRKRIQREKEDSSFILDFGEIKDNKSLVTASFPVAIPNGDYTVCKSCEKVSKGDSVLVGWVGNEAVVIDIISEG